MRAKGHGTWSRISTLAALLCAACGGTGTADLPQRSSSGSQETGSDDSAGTYDGGRLGDSSLGGGSGSIFGGSSGVSDGGDVADGAYDWAPTCVGRCPTSQVCCVDLPPPAFAGAATSVSASSCHVGSCPPVLPGGDPLQICSSAGECLTPGATCGPIGAGDPGSAASQWLPVMVCVAPRDSGVPGPGDGGSAEGGSSLGADI
jgi:hypothetical protein